MKRKAVVLVSGGLDSAVVLYSARKEGYDCRCLTFDYGQRHKKEIASARRLAAKSGSKLTIVKLDLPWKGSSLLDDNEALPVDRTIEEIARRIPSTYVPGRNTIFLATAASFAESLGASSVFIGAHYEDSSGYPDCRKEYLETFNRVIGLGTKCGLQGRLDMRFPLIEMAKKEIILLGDSLGVPFELTWSCYEGADEPCARCDSCVLRAKGFREAGLRDPLMSETYA